MPDSAHLPELPSPQSFASELIKARAERAWTQAQLAANCGVSLSAIKAYEAGRNLPGARELRELCQALQVSPNKLLFGTEAPFEQRSFAELLVDGERESEHVAKARIALMLSLLASDERAAVYTLVSSLAIARHGEEETKKAVLAADLMVGIGRAFGKSTRDAVVDGKPVDVNEFSEGVESFMGRQGHKVDPKKLPKK